MLLVASRDQDLRLADSSHQSIASWRDTRALPELERFPRCALSSDTSLGVEAFNMWGVATFEVFVNAAESVDMVPDEATVEVVLRLWHPWQAKLPRVLRDDVQIDRVETFKVVLATHDEDMVVVMDHIWPLSYLWRLLPLLDSHLAIFQANFDAK